MKRTDYTLYLVTDRNLMTAPTLEKAVEEAIAGGVTVVQLREKNVETAEYYKTALAIKEICLKHGIPFIINDRLDIAMAVDADGVHLGQDDLPIPEARRLFGKNKIIGASVNDAEQAIKAVSEGADYLGVGAMFATGTKTDADLCSMEKLKAITKAVDVPIVMIGGLNEKTIPLCAEARVDGVAVVSAILSKPDIAAAARNIKEIFTRGRRKILHGIRGAVFDLDGTLFDSMDIWHDIDIEFLGKRGFEVPADYTDAVLPKSFYECAVYTRERFNLPETPEELMREWDDMAISHYKSTIELFPYVREYLAELKADGIKLAVATSLKSNFFEPCLKRHGLWEFFDAVCSVDDIGKGKENPDIFLYAAQRLGLPIEECAVFDDAYPAILSAKKAGAFTVGVYEKHSLKFRDKIASSADLFIENLNSAPILKHS